MNEYPMTSAHSVVAIVKSNKWTITSFMFFFVKGLIWLIPALTYYLIG